MAAFKSKRFLLCALLLFIGIGCILMFRRPEPSTVYKGKTIEQWLAVVALGGPGRNAASATLREAGELAVPDLVRAMTRKVPFFEKRIVPKLPGLLVRYLPYKRCILQIESVGAIWNLHLGAESVVPALRKAIPDCDYEGLDEVIRCLRIFVEGDDAALNEVRKAIPDLRQAARALNDRSGYLEGAVQKLEAQLEAQTQLNRWVPLGTSIEDVEHIMEEHHFTCSLDKIDLPWLQDPKQLSMFCRPNDVFNPTGTNPIIGVVFDVEFKSNRVWLRSVVSP